MAFTTKDPDDTYLAILNLGDANEVLHATTPKTVLDAAGNASLLALSQDTIEFLGVCNIDVAAGIVMDTGIDFESDLIVTSSLVAQADEAVGVLFTTGDPEGSLTAGIGALALRLDGSTGTTAYFKEAGVGNTGWVAVDSIVNWIDLDDTPVAYSANKWLKVNAGGDALEFVDAPTGAETLVALTDTPANYTSASLKILRVNVGADAVEFVTPFAETFLALSDTPGAFVANKMLKVNAGNTAVELGDVYVTSSPAQGEIMFYSATGWANLGVGASGEVLSSGGAGADPTWESTSAVLPSGVQGEIVYHSGSAWVVLGVGTATQVLTTGGAGANPTWEDASGGATDVLDLDDTPSGYSSDGDIVYTNGSDAWQYQGISFFMNEHVQYGAFPDDGEMMRKESTGMGWYPFVFTAMADTPSDYSGEGLAFIAVNTGESDFEFCCGGPSDGEGPMYNSGSGNWENEWRPRFYQGTADPEGSQTAEVGSFFIDTSSGTGAVLYVKAVGSGDTGWDLVTTSAS